MKTKKLTSGLLGLTLLFFACFLSSNGIAQSHSLVTKTQDCCIMKEGKMMHLENGSMRPMEKEMTMKNGTKCMTNGECVLKNGEKRKMKEGECITMDGKISECGALVEDKKAGK